MLGTHCLRMGVIIAKATWQNQGRILLCRSMVNVNSINRHKKSQLLFLGHYKHRCYIICLVYTVGYKEKCLGGRGRNGLT